MFRRIAATEPSKLYSETIGVCPCPTPLSRPGVVEGVKIAFCAGPLESHHLIEIVRCDLGKSPVTNLSDVLVLRGFPIYKALYGSGIVVNYEFPQSFAFADRANLPTLYFSFPVAQNARVI